MNLLELCSLFNHISPFAVMSKWKKCTFQWIDLLDRTDFCKQLPEIFLQHYQVVFIE